MSLGRVIYISLGRVIYISLGRVIYKVSHVAGVHYK